MRMLFKNNRLSLVTKFSRDTNGQALIETALCSLVMTLMVAVAANFAYLSYINATTGSAARQAAVYAIQGGQSVAGNALPTQIAACAVAANEVNGWLAIPSDEWSASVSSSTVGSESWAQTTACSSGGQSGPLFAADPESAYFASTAVAVAANYNMPLQFSMWGFKSLALNQFQAAHVIYIRQLN